jgi:hypothetical protein
VRNHTCKPRSAASTPLHRAIVAYARSHPHASDTLPGILHWWIPPDLCPSRAEAGAALDDLVAQGVLRRQRLIDGTELYSIPHDEEHGTGRSERCIKR